LFEIAIQNNHFHPIQQFTISFYGFSIANNEGLEYDSDVSEPNHDYAITLSLQELGGFW